MINPKSALYNHLNYLFEHSLEYTQGSNLLRAILKILAENDQHRITDIAKKVYRERSEIKIALQQLEKVDLVISENKRKIEMFRESTTHSSIFEVNNYFPEALPENDWCFTFRERVLPLIDEEKFRHLYCESDGRHKASISTMVSLLIFMGLEQYSWRGTEFQFTRRLDWLIATNTPLGQGSIDHSTCSGLFGAKTSIMLPRIAV